MQGQFLLGVILLISLALVVVCYLIGVDVGRSGRSFSEAAAAELLGAASLKKSPAGLPRGILRRSSFGGAPS